MRAAEAVRRQGLAADVFKPRTKPAGRFSILPGCSDREGRLA